MNIIVTTYPFLESRAQCLEEVSFNEVKRKYSNLEHIAILKKTQPDIIIAGTENYTKDILDIVPNLKMIARVGIGLDSVDLHECKKRGIIVTYTPDAPSNAVAELTLAQIINMLRGINTRILSWNRYIGREIRFSSIGIIGIGRIGTLVFQELSSFFPKNMLIYDIEPGKMYNLIGGIPSTKEEILRQCDIITIHIPLNESNKNYITTNELELMKPNACLLNMSRGGIINEKDIYQWLVSHPLFSVAIDTFEKEPYNGDLIKCKNAYLTPHLGSCTEMSRKRMEEEAVEDVLNFMNSSSFKNRVV